MADTNYTPPADFFNATELAKPFGKRPREFLRLRGTKVKSFVQKGSPAQGGGTWMHESALGEFRRWLELPRTGQSGEDLYVLLFTTGVIKIGRSRNAVARIKDHFYEASKYGVSVVRQYYKRHCVISERALIEYCMGVADVCSGNEYFKNLDFDGVVQFIESGSKAI